MGWQWHQLPHVEIICTSLQAANHASTLPLSFYRLDALPATPTALKHWRHKCCLLGFGNLDFENVSIGSCFGLVCCTGQWHGLLIVSAVKKWMHFSYTTGTWQYTLHMIIFCYNAHWLLHFPAPKKNWVPSYRTGVFGAAIWLHVTLVTVSNYDRVNRDFVRNAQWKCCLCWFGSDQWTRILWFADVVASWVMFSADFHRRKRSDHCRSLSFADLRCSEQHARRWSQYACKTSSHILAVGTRCPSGHCFTLFFFLLLIS